MMNRLINLFLHSSILIRVVCFGEFMESDDVDEVFQTHVDKRIDVEASLEFGKTSLWINGVQVYSHEGNTSLRGHSHFQYHTGIHYLSLHQTTFKILNKKLFYTAQPSTDKHLLRTLCNTHEGRIVILLGSTNFTSWVREELAEFLYDSGALLGPEVAAGESWALIFYKGESNWPQYELDADYWEEKSDDTEEKERRKKKRDRRKEDTLVESVTAELRENKLRELRNVTSNVNMFSDFIERRIRKKFKIIYEGLSIVRRYDKTEASPVIFSTTIHPVTEKKCAWHYSYELQDLKSFCTSYDGYGPYCRCNYRTRLLEKIGELSADTMYNYDIPVAIITSSRFPQVLRQVHQLKKATGGRKAKILLCVDGANSEAEQLAKLVGVSVIFHNNTIQKNTAHRVNVHIRWSLEKVFKFYKNSTFAILLEDDLDLSPDFLSYFEQISWLMDVDRSLVIANAYNYNAYPHTALNPSKLLLVQSYPYYGWMVRRETAKKMVDGWANIKMAADWDLYLHYMHLNNNYVVIPEVPRTKHISGGGVHVSGFVQESTYNVRPFNKEPNVTLELNRLWSKAYTLDLMKFLAEATVLNITGNICENPPISPKQVGGKYVLYLDLWGDGDNSSSFYVVSRCMGFYEENMLEQIDGTFKKNFYNNSLLIVACPVSPYCVTQDKSVIYKPTEEDVEAAQNNPFRKVKSETTLYIRTAPVDFLEEVLLDNKYNFSLHVRD